MIKAIFFDIDGTLISHRDGVVPRSAKKALFQLRDKGIKIFLASGRHMMEIRNLPVNEIPFDGYLTLNGQLCLDAEGALLYDHPIAADDLMRMASVFQQKTIPVTMIEKDRMYINYVDDAVEKAQKSITYAVPEIGSLSDEKIYQIVIYTDKNTADSVIGELPNCCMTCWSNCAFDIIAKEGGKAAGIRKILRYYGIDKTEIMAFGDGDNDIDMLRYAKIGIAMGNAVAEVKNLASYVTDSVDNDGIYKALKHCKIL